MNALSDTLHPRSIDIHLEPPDNNRLINLCGPLNKNLRHIERRLGVEINNRENTFRIIGAGKSVDLTEQLLQSLYEMTAIETLSPEKVHFHIQDTGVERDDEEDEDTDTNIKTSLGIIRGRSPNQRCYLRNIFDHDISFGIGPAGTGKTYLAVVCAIAALEQDRARRIVLARPAVEAGENLGFLPGDLIQKVDPYLRPLYDTLYEMLGFEKVAKYIEHNVIEVAPLAFMRGRTLNESFIILDEAQNTTVEQMKMFLTRIGFGSTAVITGDITQVDLPRGKDSGLRQVIDILSEEEDISFTFFNSKDIVRHPLVARILDAYERHEQESQN